VSFSIFFCSSWDGLTQTQVEKDVSAWASKKKNSQSASKQLKFGKIIVVIFHHYQLATKIIRIFQNKKKFKKQLQNKLIFSFSRIKKPISINSNNKTIPLKNEETSIKSNKNKFSFP
jgi:hypothetical protein